MAGRGVHFSLTRSQLARILATKDDASLMTFVEELEEVWDKEWLAESDKAWDAIHRCLTDGSLLYESGDYPLNHVICGGRQLYQNDDYIVTLVTPEQIKDVASTLESVDKPWLRGRYFSLLESDDYAGEIGEEDFEYTWGWFQGVRDLFIKSALSDRAVIFTVDA